MKTNFTLNRHNADLLVQKIEKAINKHNKIALNHQWSGAQEQRGFLQKAITNVRNFHLPVAKCITSYISVGDYVIEHDKEMGLVRINWQKHKYSDFEYGSGMIIRYGQKMKVHSGKIEYRSFDIYIKKGMFSTFTLIP